MLSIECSTETWKILRDPRLAVIDLQCGMILAMIYSAVRRMRQLLEMLFGRAWQCVASYTAYSVDIKINGTEVSNTWSVRDNTVSTYKMRVQNIYRSCSSVFLPPGDSDQLL